MKYALNLDTDGHILSATYPQYAPADSPIVDTLPEGDISEYRYVDGEFIYEPLLKAETQAPTTPTTEDRLSALEAVVTEMILGGGRDE